MSSVSDEDVIAGAATEAVTETTAITSTDAATGVDDTGTRALTQSDTGSGANTFDKLSTFADVATGTETTNIAFTAIDLVTLSDPYDLLVVSLAPVGLLERKWAAVVSNTSTVNNRWAESTDHTRWNGEVLNDGD